jgi:hypothetical protein
MDSCLFTKFRYFKHDVMKFFLSLFSILVVFTTCSKRPSGAPGANEIWLEYKLFNPSQITVTAGTTVKFINKDNANHSVTNVNGIFNSGKIKSGDSFSYTFSTPGSYGFSCQYHSTGSGGSEQGYINVQ